VCALQGLISARGRCSNGRGEIMHEPKVSALAAQDCYYIAQVH